MQRSCNVIPYYSVNFSLVQNFVELLATALEEIFVVLIFPPSPRGDHTHIDQQFRGSYFRGARPNREKYNFAPCENFPLYGTRCIQPLT
jgi:hypothetical protein